MLHRSRWNPFRCMTMMAMVLNGLLHFGLGAQIDPETARRYEGVVMEVLTTRLASDVTVDRGRVALRTPASRTVKDLTAVVRASVPYYLEGALVEFKRFRPRVKEALAALDGWEVPPAPRGWDEGEWTYFQVQGAVEEVVLLVALTSGSSPISLWPMMYAPGKSSLRTGRESEGGRIPSTPAHCLISETLLRTSARWMDWAEVLTKVASPPTTWPRHSGS